MGWFLFCSSKSPLKILWILCCLAISSLCARGLARPATLPGVCISLPGVCIPIWWKIISTSSSHHWVLDARQSALVTPLSLDEPLAPASRLKMSSSSCGNQFRWMTLFFCLKHQKNDALLLPEASWEILLPELDRICTPRISYLAHQLHMPLPLNLHFLFFSLIEKIFLSSRLLSVHLDIMSDWIRYYSHLWNSHRITHDFNIISINWSSLHVGCISCTIFL